MNNETKLVKFMDSPKMSSYLLAIIVAEFDYVQSQTKRGTLVRIFAPLKQAKNASFALKDTVACLELYEEWFKMD